MRDAGRGDVQHVQLKRFVRTGLRGCACTSRRRAGRWRSTAAADVAGLLGRAVVMDQVPIVCGPRYQPVNGGISQTASAVNIVTRVSMS